MAISKLLNEVQRDIAMNNGEKIKGVKITEEYCKEIFENMTILNPEEQQEFENKGYVQNICGLNLIIDNSVEGDYQIFR